MKAHGRVFGLDDGGEDEPVWFRHMPAYEFEPTELPDAGEDGAHLDWKGNGDYNAAEVDSDSFQDPDAMIIDFKDIHHLIPNFVFNEYGQLTGNYVSYGEIVCVSEDGRIRIWLNREAFETRDAEGLICDYDEQVLRGLAG